MDKLSLMPVINIYKDYNYSIVEDSESFVVMEKNIGNNVEKVMIPKYEIEHSDYVNSIILKINRLLNQNQDNKVEVEKLEFQRDSLKQVMINSKEKLSFRIPNKENIDLKFINKLTQKLLNLSINYGKMSGNNKYCDGFTFLPTTKGSFVVNIALPEQQSNQITYEDGNNNINGRFINIISNLLNKNDDELFSNYNRRNISYLKDFVKGLKNFATDILGKVEVYSIDSKEIKKIVEILNKEENKSIISSLKDIEETLQNITKVPKMELTLLGATRPIRNRMSQLKFLTTVNGVDDCEFIWSGLPEDMFKKIIEKDKEDETVILKNVEYIKLKNYYRILSAESI